MSDHLELLTPPATARPALIDFIPSRIIHTPPRNGYEEDWTFYILPPGYIDVVEIPVNGFFGVVYSPNVFQSAASRTGWRYVHFRVKLSRIKGVDKEPSRYYAEESKRPLTDVEQTYFERLAWIELNKQPELEKV